ncbi:MAG: hypothetical protein U0524_00905 [Candidatus Saccharimonadales bacterium]
MKKDSNTSTINTNEIEITSIYLSKDGDQIRFQSIPRNLMYKGRKYVLAEA